MLTSNYSLSKSARQRCSSYRSAPPDSLAALFNGSGSVSWSARSAHSFSWSRTLPVSWSYALADVMVRFTSRFQSYTWEES